MACRSLHSLGCKTGVEMTDKSKISPPRLGDKVFERLGKDLDGPLSEADYKRVLEGFYIVHGEDFEDTYPALLALLQVARDVPSADAPEPGPFADISVPWWVVEAIAYGIQKYERAPSGKTFGECLGIESGGQGKDRSRDRFRTKLKDLLLADEVAIESERFARLRNTKPIDRAITEVANRHGYRPSTIKKAWQTYRKKVWKRSN